MMEDIGGNGRDKMEGRKEGRKEGKKEKNVLGEVLVSHYRINPLLASLSHPLAGAR